LRFFAAHFVAKLDTISGKVLRETLHGHNYKVTCEVIGPKQKDSPYIIDKNDIQDAAKRVCDSFHSKMLIPTRSPALVVQDFFPDKDHVTMRVKNVNEVFQFPRRDTLLLDVEYTSIEDLGEVISNLIYAELAKKGPHVTSNIQKLKVSVQEYPGLKCVRCMELGITKPSPKL
jgi:6-pyruvoyl-tetrahydropterin synthase